METTKNNYVSNLISTGNRKKLFSYLHHLSSSSTIPTCVYASEPGIPTQSSLETVEAFNAHFHSICTLSEYVLPPFEHLPAPSHQLHTITIDIEDVKNAIDSLDATKAYGCDDIDPCLIQICSHHALLTHLTTLYQLCMTTNSIPHQWKVHKIIPIHKKGNHSLISNYRPISLLCTASTILETIIFQKIIDFVRPQLSPHQFGFLSNHSCLTNLLTTYTAISKSLDNGHTTDVVYLDFAKAFDTLPHTKLLYKLWRIGITGPLWLWFRGYLEDRQHFVQINDTQSSRLPVLSGVPQGNVLGPLLFLIFIDDLADSVSHSTVSLFADDTKLLLDVIESNSSVLQSDLSAISQWCTQWELKLNLDKCSLIRFSLSHLNSDSSYSIDNHVISISQEVPDLGIIVNNKLSFSPHYKSICSKAYQTLFMVRRTLRLTSAPVSIKKQIYLTLVRSKLTYCCQLWRPYLIKDITMLENVQRRATKFITGDYESDYKSRLLKLDLLPLMHWYELQDLLFLIKCLQNQPDNINIYDHVKFVNSGTRRNNHTLQYNYTRTTAARHFFFNRVVRLWNALQPINIDLRTFQLHQTSPH